MPPNLDQRLVGADAALQAVADASSGLGLVAAGGLGSAALLAAALPPEAQLPAVLRLAEAREAAGEAQLQRVLAGAAVRLLTSHQQGAAAAAQAAAAIDQLLLPRLAAECAAGDAAAQQWEQELEQAVADVVACCDCWDAGLQLVQAAVGGSSPAAAASRLPAHVRVRLAAAAIQRALQADGAAVPQAELPQQPGRQELLRYAGGDALPAVLALVTAAPGLQGKQSRAKRGQPSEAAQAAAAAARTLLPAALQAATQQGHGAAALQQLWDACK